jgi:hypothetical protein
LEADKSFGEKSGLYFKDTREAVETSDIIVSSLPGDDIYPYKETRREKGALYMDGYQLESMFWEEGRTV